MQPTILAFRLSDERLHTLRAVASAQGLAIIAVPPSDFSQTLGALCAWMRAICWLRPAILQAKCW